MIMVGCGIKHKNKWDSKSIIKSVIKWWIGDNDNNNLETREDRIADK